MPSRFYQCINYLLSADVVSKYTHVMVESRAIFQNRNLSKANKRIVIHENIKVAIKINFLSLYELIFLPGKLKV